MLSSGGRRVRPSAPEKRGEHGQQIVQDQLAVGFAHFDSFLSEARLAARARHAAFALDEPNQSSGKAERVSAPPVAVVVDSETISNLLEHRVADVLVE